MTRFRIWRQMCFTTLRLQTTQKVAQPSSERYRAMLERLTLPETHAISILIKDHDAVKDLFDRFEECSESEKESIIDQAVTELKIHAVIEDEIFYPTVRKRVGEDVMN